MRTRTQRHPRDVRARELVESSAFIGATPSVKLQLANFIRVTDYDRARRTPIVGRAW